MGGCGNVDDDVDDADYDADDDDDDHDFGVVTESIVGPLCWQVHQKHKQLGTASPYVHTLVHASGHKLLEKRSQPLEHRANAASVSSGIRISK